LLKSNLNWNINFAIRSPELRVLGPDGKQIGVLSKQEALNKAQEMGLDLIEIAPTAKPPVAKIVEFGKFRYEQEKKLKKEKKKTKASDVKEIRFSPFIGDHDFNNRIERISEFLEERNKVRLAVVFRMRQLGSKQFGYDLMKRIFLSFQGRIAVDMEPKFLGRNLIAVISPLAKVKKTEAEELADQETFKE
jgi:translation initiation factor IF-3